MKSDYLEEEKKLDLKKLNKAHLNEIKKVLLKQIIEQDELNSALAVRCDKVKDIIDLFETNI